MRHSLIAAGALVLAIGLLAGCGSDGDSDGRPAGIQLGDEVLASPKVGASVEPWLVWDPDDCTFEETDDHPAKYSADLRAIEGDAPQLGYMHYGNTDPFGVAVSKSIEREAKEVGMDVNVYNLKFPSRTEPNTVAQSSVVQQDDVVIQANLDPTVLPPFHDILEGQGCIPSIQLFIPIDGRPAFGNYWPDVGKTIGTYIGEEAQARNWDPADTALVQCTDRDSGPTVNELFKHTHPAAAEAGFEIPEENRFDIVCGLTDPQAGYKKVTDWYTAHPNFKHVAFTAIDSIRSVEMARAIRDEGRPRQDAILAAGADDEASRAAVRKGDQDMSVAFFGEKFGEWLVPMVEDILAGNPVPSFVGTELIPLTKENIDEYYPEG